MFGSRPARGATFSHDMLPVTEISDETVDGVRFYTTPSGAVYPSVTTVIGAHKGDAWLKAWKKRAGEEKVREVGGKARVRGRAFHHICEQYLLNDDDWAEGAMPSNLYAFRSIQKVLDERIGVVRGIEYPLWSDRLRTAGRTDLIAEFDGVPSILDFKTSLRPKTEDQVHGYFVQKTCYGEMVEERVGLEVPQIVTIMAVDHEPCQVWVKKRADYVSDVEDIFLHR